MTPQPHLSLVNTSTGEVVGDGCPNCQNLQDQLDGKEKDLAAWRVRYANLKRDKEAEARDHKLWPVAVELHRAWRTRCNHPRCSFGAAEFELVRVLLQDKRYGETLDDRKAMCLRAIAGAEFDHGTKVMRNGSLRRYDDWELIFRNRSKLQDFANRAPSDWRIRMASYLPAAEEAA